MKWKVEVKHEYEKIQHLEVEAETEAEAQRLANSHPVIDWGEPEHTGYDVSVSPA